MKTLFQHLGFSVAIILTLGFVCSIVLFVSAEQRPEKGRERSTDVLQGNQASPTSTKLDVLSLHVDYVDPTYFDSQRTETSVTRINRTAQVLDGQWVLKKDIPLSAMVSWKFQRDGTPGMKKPPQNLCSEIIAPMTGINMFYTNLGFTKCPVKKGVYSFNHFIIPNITIPKTLVSADKWTTTYEWHTFGKKPLLKFTTVVKFVPDA